MLTVGLLVLQLFQSLLLHPAHVQADSKEGMFAKTINMSNSEWSLSTTSERMADTIYVCAATCLLKKENEPCNAFSYTEESKICQTANISVLEDSTSEEAKEIYVNVNVMHNIDMRCRGGENCCLKERANFLCDKKEGDCNRDDECMHGLKCGENSCTQKYSLTGYLFDEEDDCCEPKCTQETPCATGEGICEDSSGCSNSTWVQCQLCSDKELFTEDLFPEMSLYTEEDKCCRRPCLPSHQCEYLSIGCNHREDCVTGLTCIIKGDKPTCLDLNECEDDPNICGSDVCINLVGSYRCIKEDEDRVPVIIGGYELHTDTFYPNAEVLGYNTTCTNTIPTFPRNFVGGRITYNMNYLYACGGVNLPHNPQTLGSCYKLNLREEDPDWESMPDMPHGRQAFVFLGNGYNLYALFGAWHDGAHTGGGHGASDRFDTLSNNWVTITDHNGYSLEEYETSEGCAVLDKVNNEAYVLGGYTPQKGLIIEAVRIDLKVPKYIHPREFSLPYAAAVLGCGLIRMADTNERLLIITGGESSGRPSCSNCHSYYMYFDKNRSWYSLASETTYIREMNVILKNDWQADIVGDRDTSYTGPYREYVYEWYDKTVVKSGYGIKRNSDRSRMIRDLVGVTAIPRSSKVIGEGCI